jgi:hypothetical protein
MEICKRCEKPFTPRPIHFGGTKRMTRMCEDCHKEILSKYGGIEKVCQTCKGKYIVDTKHYSNGWYNHFHCSGCCAAKRS